MGAKHHPHLHLSSDCPYCLWPLHYPRILELRKGKALVTCRQCKKAMEIQTTTNKKGITTPIQGSYQRCGKTFPKYTWQLTLFDGSQQ
jgi:hypothetical protein